jgi:integrase
LSYKTEPQNEGLAGATEQQDTKGKLLQFAIWMNREGYHESTIHHSTYSLDLLHRHGANLLEPDSIKEVLSKLKNSNATKSIMSKDYKLFTKYLGIKWEKPRYTPEQKLPFIPTEREIDDLIAYVKPRIGLALKIAKETGARIGEIAALEWLDIDLERKFLRINKPEKGSLPRAMQISNELVNALQAFKNRQKTLGKYIFQLGEGHTPSRSMQATLASAKKRLAFRLNNPRLHEIHFHIIRHWKGTMEYHKTKDIMHVKKILGHKSINSTMVYINLEQAIFTDAPEEFHIKVTDNLEEACKLLEVGFEYVTDMEGKKVFRKRK